MNFGINHFESLDQFSPSSYEIEFILFNQILLSLFDISSTFYNNIWLNIKTKMCQNNSKIILKCVSNIK